MAKALKAFDRLLDAKRRRIGKCEAAVAQEREALRACEAQHQQAVAKEQACRGEEAGCAAKIDALARRLEQDQEDAQDEESEETAVARLVAAARRATETALPAA